MSYFKQDDSGITKFLKLLCFVPFAIISVIIRLYNLLLKYPPYHRPLFIMGRIAFWFMFILALTNVDTNSFPIAWGNSVDSFLNQHGFLKTFFYPIIIFLPLSQVPALFRQGEPSAPGDNIREGFSFLDQMLNQQSTRGKTEMLSKFFGGDISKK